MPYPTTKAELLTEMREGHRVFYEMLACIPDERMTEVALYDTWSIKDFIAHIGWWQQNASERMAAARRGDTPQVFHDFDEINQEVFERYRDMPLDEVRKMEAEGFAAVESIIESIDNENELFDGTYYTATKGRPLSSYAAGNTFGHYNTHIDDVRAWMTKYNLA